MFPAKVSCGSVNRTVQHDSWFPSEEATERLGENV